MAGQPPSEPAHVTPTPRVFSDCAIRRPKVCGRGSIFRKMQVSASRFPALLRPGAWLLIQGAGVRAEPAKLQFPALATRLVYGRLRHHFEGGRPLSGFVCFDRGRRRWCRGNGFGEPWRARAERRTTSRWLCKGSRRCPGSESIADHRGNFVRAEVFADLVPDDGARLTTGAPRHTSRDENREGLIEPK